MSLITPLEAKNIQEYIKKIVLKVAKSMRRTIWQNATVVSVDVLNDTAVVIIAGDTTEINVKVQDWLTNKISNGDAVVLLEFKGENRSVIHRLVVNKL